MRTNRLFPVQLPLLLVLLLGHVLTAGLPAQASAECPISWSVVFTPQGLGSDNSLGGLAVISANDVWAVGNTGTGTSPVRTLAEHWNGSSWSVVPSPNGRFAVNYLPAVSAVSSTDVWAVGFSHNGSVSNSQSRTLILHWNGSSWSVVPSPNTPRPENRLYGLVAISADDVWAVGTSYNFSVYRSLIMHWNGAAWTIIPGPGPSSPFDILYGVDAVSADNVWAVGTRQDSLEQTLVMHWDGAGWTVVPSPQVGPYGNNMLKVAAVAANDIWAVGYHLTVVGFSEPYQTSIFHYDGTSWTVVPSPNVNQLNNYLFDVAGLASNDAWAVGFWDTGTAYQTMVQHWDGTSWSLVPSPNPQPYTNELYGVEAVTSTDVWAVGRASDGLTGGATLALHYGSACAGAMHISSIEPRFVAGPGGGFLVGASIWVVDAGDAAVPDAAVAVKVTYPDGSTISRVRATGLDGAARLSLTATQTGQYTFTVIGVAKTGWTYDPTANKETSDTIDVR